MSYESKVFKGPLASGVIPAAAGRSCFGAVLNGWIHRKHRNLLKITSISCLNLDCSPTSRKKTEHLLSKQTCPGRSTVDTGRNRAWPRSQQWRWTLNRLPRVTWQPCLVSLSARFSLNQACLGRLAKHQTMEMQLLDFFPDWKIIFETCPLHEFIHRIIHSFLPPKDIHTPKEAPWNTLDAFIASFAVTRSGRKPALHAFLFPSNEPYLVFHDLEGLQNWQSKEA